MVNSPSPGFWNQWDIQTLHYPDFNLASGLSLVAILALEALSPMKYENFTNWQDRDRYRYLGPIIASVASLVLVNSSSWLANLELGATTEMIIYSGIFILNAIIQIAGNGYSIFILGLYSLLASIFVGAFVVIPVLAISNPFTIALFAFFVIAGSVPLLMNFGGFFISIGAFIGVLTFIFSAVDMLETHPDSVFEILQDLFENGLDSSIFIEWEDNIKMNLGYNFLGNLIGIDTLRDILDNIGIHLGLHLLIVLPLTVLLQLGKLVAFIIFLLFQTDFEKPLILFAYIFISDGGLGALIAVVAKLLTFSDQSRLFFLLDGIGRAFIHSFLTIEGGYWGIYFLVLLIRNWVNGENISASNSNIPEVQQDNLGVELIESLFDFVKEAWCDLSNRFEWTVLEPAIFEKLLPLVLVATWAFQYPFFQGMLNHILALSEQS